MTRHACAALMVLCSVSSSVAAQDGLVPVDEAQVTDAQLADAWMRELEDRLDTSDSVMKYFVAPFLMVEGLVFLGVGAFASDLNVLTRTLVGAHGSLWLSAGAAYYAASDPESGMRAFGAVGSLANMMLYGAMFPLQTDCGGGITLACSDGALGRDGRTLLSTVAGFGLAVSALSLAHSIFVEPPRVADLRVGFAALTGAQKRERVLAYLRAVDDLRWNYGAVTVALGIVATGVTTYLALAADTDDGQLIMGSAAAYLGAVTVGSLLMLLLTTPDSERLLAGAMPEE